jgi:hypothetical protein
MLLMLDVARIRVEKEAGVGIASVIQANSSVPLVRIAGTGLGDRG